MLKSSVFCELLSYNEMCLRNLWYETSPINLPLPGLFPHKTLFGMSI